jgi:Protein of unknown function (DUF3152)
VVPSSPPAPPSPDQGLGTFSRTASGGTEVYGHAGVLITYCVRVEDGINSVPPNDFALFADAALGDARGWTAARRWRFQRIATCDGANLRINLATPATVDRMCRGQADTGGQWSCRNGDDVNINLTRWREAVPHAPDRTTYRIMVMNHEVGHYLGFAHATCPGPGRTAPIMLPQSRTMGGCVFNPFPYPDGLTFVG